MRELDEDPGPHGAGPEPPPVRPPSLNELLAARQADFLRRRNAVIACMIENSIDVRAQAALPNLLVIVPVDFVEMTPEAKRVAEKALAG